MSSELAISCSDVGKAYAIYRRPEDRLKQMLWSFLRPGKKQYYDVYWALRGVSIDIKRGESVAIIGRNGSGKSTFLQTVCGTLQPTNGQISVNGRIAALLELGAGFNPEFTGRENVFLSATILGLTQSQIEARYDTIAEFAGIGDFINQPVKFYSSGMYARLAFAVAAHVDADILIIDEILAVGDAAFTQRCMHFIRRFKERGTLLFVSHDSNSVVSLCDRALWLEGGQTRELGKADEVCHNYLASILSEQEDPARFQIGGVRSERRPQVTKDPRHDLLASSQLKNIVEVFDFDPNSKWFGERGGSIVDVKFTDTAGVALQVLAGGEVIELRIWARADRQILRPILGFYVKDRLGQRLFGDNTFLCGSEKNGVERTLEAADIGLAVFKFQLPYLPPGDFSITVALSSGTPAEHTHHHWIEDALFFHVATSHLQRGLVGIPMLDISLRKVSKIGNHANDEPAKPIEGGVGAV